MIISKKALDTLANQINTATSSPTSAYTRINDRNVANIGNYHISSTYGGYTLHRMMNADGGVVDILGCGYIPKRELFNLMRAYLAGIERGDQS